MASSDHIQALRRLTDRYRGQLAVDAVRAGQAVILDGMRRRCPVGPTHRLYASIHATRVRAGRRSAGGAVIVGTDHAIPVEFGTIHMRAHPFVRPTAAVDGPRAEAAMAAVLSRGN